MKNRTYMYIGAHPDDADIHFAGTAILLKELGHDIIFVSTTDGSAGHQTMTREEIRKRRLAETQEVAKFLDIQYIAMDAVDTELTPDISTRNKLIKLIREKKPDVIISPRPFDYHPDHRAAGQLVQDSSFLLTVPLCCPEAPRLEKVPYMFYNQDIFTKPLSFTPDIITNITPVIDKKMESLSLHESQVFEWLPFVYPITENIPTTKEEKIDFCKRNWGNRGGAL